MPAPFKPSSPDALKASLLTVSNIDIDIPVQQDNDLKQRQVQGPQSAVSPHQAANEPLTHSVCKDSKVKGKLDPSPPSSPVKPPLRSASGVCSRGGDEGRAANEVSDIHQWATPNPEDTFSILGEKKIPDMDEMDDTMELLKNADAQNPHQENVEDAVEVDADNKNNPVTLIKQVPVQHLRSSDMQVSFLKYILLMFLLAVLFLCFMCSILSL